MVDDNSHQVNKTSQLNNSDSRLENIADIQQEGLSEDVADASFTTNDSTELTIVANCDDKEIDRKSVIIVTGEEFSDDCQPDCESDFEFTDLCGDNRNRSHENNKHLMITCSSCTAEFNSWYALKTHEKQVHSVKSLERNVCCETVLPEEFKKHVASQHRSMENQCEYCGLQYRTRKQLEFHLNSHRGKPFCSFCGKEFKRVAQRDLHEKTHTDISSLLCELCGCLFFEQQTFNKHIRSHNKVNAISCEFCSRSFEKESDLKLHLAKYPEKFPCLICYKQFHLKVRLQQHVLCHSNERPFVCFCGVSFNRKGNLSQHMTKFHDRIGESFKCDICKRLFKSKNSLKWHMAKHAGDKSPYDCEVCEKRFGDIVRYKNHIRSHTGERPFACSFCSKLFSSKSNVKQHELVHQNIYKYHCTMCDRLFKRLHSFIIHKRTHTGERPFVCNVCNKGFLQKYDLKRHAKVHIKCVANGRGADENIALSEIPNDNETVSEIPNENEAVSEIPNDKKMLSEIPNDKETLAKTPELETANVVPPLTSSNIEFCTVDDIVSFTNAELQLLNMPLVCFKPLMPTPSNNSKHL